MHVVHRYLPRQLVRSDTLAAFERAVTIRLNLGLEFLQPLSLALHRLADFLVDLQAFSALLQLLTEELDVLFARKNSACWRGP